MIKTILALTIIPLSLACSSPAADGIKPDLGASTQALDLIVQTPDPCSTPVSEEGITGNYELVYTAVDAGAPRTSESVAFTGGQWPMFAPFAPLSGCGSATVGPDCRIAQVSACPAGVSSASYSVSGTMDFDETTSSALFPAANLTGTLQIGSDSWTFTGAYQGTLHP